MNERIDPRKQKKQERKALEEAKKRAATERRERAAAVLAPTPDLPDGCPIVRFEPMDTWFFRESRPFETIGGSEMASVFPPPPRTLLGAVRTAIGDAGGVDWNEFKDDPESPWRQVIGFGDDLGPLSLSGPWLNDGERLYPVPLLLLAKGEGEKADLARLRIGQAADTYLGRVRLPELPQGKQGYKPLGRAWITRTGLEAVLKAEVPAGKTIRRAGELFREEARLGIARDNARRITDEGLLYQTRHLRPKSGLAIEADITVAQGTKLPSGMARLGGEGRLAHLAADKTPAFPEAPTPTGDTRGLILLLLTPARFPDRFPDREGWLPPGFSSEEIDGQRIWKGRIAEVALTLHAAVLGKALREGGWDLANHRPRPVQSLVPAGSAYYVTVEGDFGVAIRTLHNTHIGEDRSLGRGHIVCGLWNAHEF